VDEQRDGAREDSRTFLYVELALLRLENKDPRLVWIFEYRFFAGLTDKETPRILGVSRKTVQRDWAAPAPGSGPS
jgi:hypothetical protein